MDYFLYLCDLKLEYYTNEKISLSYYHIFDDRLFGSVWTFSKNDCHSGS